jgi:hypothetical protein
LLDLAARGWLRLDEQPGEPLMCTVTGNRADDELTDYERRVYAQVVSRAGTQDSVPAHALSDGFAGPAMAGTGGQDLKSAKDSFMGGFKDEVIADAHRRGLLRKRLSEGPGCLLWVLALVPAVISGLALHASGRRGYWIWISVAGYVALCAVSGLAIQREQLTPAGRDVLRRSRARCAGPGGATSLAGGMPPGQAGPGPGSMAATVPPGWPDRHVACCVALGRAKAVAALFSPPKGRAQVKTMWSGYGGHWRRVTIDPFPPVESDWAGCGLVLIGAVILPVTAAAVLGMLAAQVAVPFLVISGALLLARVAARNRRLPRSAEFDGQVIEAWLQQVPSGTAGPQSTGSVRVPYIAIDDGIRDQAWALRVSNEQYAMFTPGTLVHAKVNLRSNDLLEIRPVTTARG